MDFRILMGSRLFTKVNFSINQAPADNSGFAGIAVPSHGCEREAATIHLEDINLKPDTLSRLRLAANEVSAGEEALIGERLACVATAARAAASHWKFTAPAAIIEMFIKQIAPSADFDPCAKSRLRRVIVARLALGFFEVWEKLPASVVSLLPSTLEQLAAFLSRARTYNDDYFAKDVRYALGQTLRCGAMQIDVNGSVGPKLLLRHLRRTGGLAGPAKYIFARGWKRWYIDHLDPRYMAEFHPAGWTVFFIRAAQLLELNPDVRGIAGASWFNDPRVAEISAELAFMQMPMKHGAFCADMGTTPQDVSYAIALSAKRKSLYERGEYTPKCFLVMWPRADIIAWSREAITDPSLTFEHFSAPGRSQAKKSDFADGQEFLA